MVDDNNPIARRSFLVGAGTAVAAGLTPPAQAQTAQPVAAPAAPPTNEPETLLTLTPTEHAFFVTAVDIIIPADELSPSGSQCGVATFIDRQLAGAFGNGARLYRDGPFTKGKPELGYQLALTPANSSAPASRPPTNGRARLTARTSTVCRKRIAKRP